MSLPIHEYAALGDSETAALVSRGGSIDWLCLPRFDSPACFAALLGEPRHGRWLLGPADSDAVSTRSYLGNTFVLETIHRTKDGAVKVTDLMPLADGRADLIRRVEGLEGTVRMRHEWIVRFSYGLVRPWVRRRQDTSGQEVISAIAGPDMLVLRGDRLPSARDGVHEDDFDVRVGESMTFSTTWFKSHLDIPEMLDVEERLQHTIALSRAWADQCNYEGPYRDAVLRSLLVLRLLTHAETGGIVAAATTSLPEDFGGERNWDYRFCWLRDASLTLASLIAAGYIDEARLWRDWLLRAIAGDPQDLQIMYAVDGGRELPERTLDHLPGYAGSLPVRIGNAAVDQRQSDVLGEVMMALALARQAHGPSEEAWNLQRTLVNELAQHWREPDNGLWEIRGEPQHFTHSRLMVWVAFDRAVHAVETHGLAGKVEEWRAIRDEVREEIMTKGFDADRNTFVQHYDTTEVDASLLYVGSVGFLPGDDPKVLGTIRAIEQDLIRDGLVLRYRTETGVDGLEGDEHPFLACSFWLVGAYARAGRVEDAEELMTRLLALTNDVGLLSEEYDPRHDRMVGNFPQAFSHLTLVRAAIAIADARNDGAAGSTSTTDSE